MKRKKVLTIVLMLLVILFTVMPMGTGQFKVEASEAYQKVDSSLGSVTEAEVNLRTGPAKTFDIICKLKKDQKVTVIGKLGSWYAVYVGSSGNVGAISSQYLKIETAKAATTTNKATSASKAATTGKKATTANATTTKKAAAKNATTTNKVTSASKAVTTTEKATTAAKNAATTKKANTASKAVTTTNKATPATQNTDSTSKAATKTNAEDATTVSKVKDISSDEQILLDLVNKARKEKGLKALVFDADLLKVARLKAKDMKDNNYFSHTSKFYGTPFDMMKKYKIKFSAAGENIAGNQTIEKAVKAWSSESGNNLFNEKFTHTGIGIVDSPTYGKLFVQMFIKKI